MDEVDVVHIHNRISLSHKTEGNLAICDSVDDLDSIMLSEISHTEEYIYHMV